MFIMGCPGGKINMAAVSAKRGVAGHLRILMIHCGGIFKHECSIKRHNYSWFVDDRKFFGLTTLARATLCSQRTLSEIDS